MKKRASEIQGRLNEVRAIIKRKAAAGDKAVSAAPVTAAPKAGKVIDIMTLIKPSVEAAERRPAGERKPPPERFRAERQAERHARNADVRAGGAAER